MKEIYDWPNYLIVVNEDAWPRFECALCTINFEWHDDHCEEVTDGIIPRKDRSFFLREVVLALWGRAQVFLLVIIPASEGEDPSFFWWARSQLFLSGWFQFSLREAISQLIRGRFQLFLRRIILDFECPNIFWGGPPQHFLKGNDPAFSDEGDLSFFWMKWSQLLSERGDPSCLCKRRF